MFHVKLVFSIILFFFLVPFKLNATVCHHYSLSVLKKRPLIKFVLLKSLKLSKFDNMSTNFVVYLMFSVKNHIKLKKNNI